MLQFLGILNKVDYLPSKRSNQLHKILLRARLNHFFKNIRKKEIQSIYVLEIFRIKRSIFIKLLNRFR